MTRRIIISMGSRGFRSSPARERGQVTMLFALVFTFMAVLFCFVVDFSHLIHARMSLQLAADSAAYAGAAWQARSLNRLGQINYRIRQDLKEMVMRLQVTHLRHNRDYPRGDGAINGGAAAPTTELFVCQQAHGYQALSGLKYAKDTNLCRNASPSTGGLPPIAVPPVIATFDPFAIAIQAQIRKINEAAKGECRAAALDNRIMAEHLINVFTQRSQYHAQQMQDISAWINEIGGGVVTETDQNPIRTTAFNSARRNLSLAARDEFRMQILAPSGGEYIRLNEHKLRGTVFYIQYNVEGEGCVGRPGFIDFTDMVASLSKEQPIITYFAVKLSAKPKLMFVPQAWIDAAFPTIEAFSAAKPFGGRIGPDGNADILTPVADRPGNNNRIMNFSFRPGDQLGMLNTKVMALLDKMHPFNEIGRPDGFQQTGWPDVDSGTPTAAKAPLTAIRAPTIFDALFYTIFPDPGSSKEQDYEEANYAEYIYPDYMEAADANNNLYDLPRPLASAYHPSSVGSKNKGTGYIQLDAEGTASGPYGSYAAEGPASHSITLGSNIPGIQGKEREFGWATREQVHSGWRPNNGEGRIGYSVKFIGMDALVRTMIVKQNSSGARGPISNPPTGDPNIPFVYH